MKDIVISGQMKGVSVDRAARTAEYNMSEHWHPACEMQYFFEGKRHFFVDQQQYAVESGS